ncbi:MAG: SagB/ThcOx family dehydrogenase [Vicinamibacterales bacterium]
MSDAGGSSSPLAYHHATKHGFGRFAKSLGYLDWANQPNPFRRFPGAPLTLLPRRAELRDVPYEALYTNKVPTEAVSPETIAEFLRCALGLSAWKSHGSSRWALRVNPSSGNLHPTESYLVWDGGVYHYAPDEHALEQRAELPGTGWPGPRADGSGTSACFLVALTSIHWREAWKYGERAFRYCQHDIGHAVGALRFSAAMLGWRMTVLPAWSHEDVSSMLGLDRAQDFGDAEREEPALIAFVTAAPLDSLNVDPAPLVEAARSATWRGHANRLSPAHTDWPTIEAVALATVDPGDEPRDPIAVGSTRYVGTSDSLQARQVVLRRRSAIAFDPRGTLRRETFLSMLERLRPTAPPWDVLTWQPQAHLALFVHRVQDLQPGIYAYLRSGDGVRDDWGSRMRSDFLWEHVPATGSGKDDGLFLLAPLDVRVLANRLSCDQDIAGDGFFSLGMLARLAAVREQGPWMYRRLFWECGLIGQILYLEAEAAGARGTGIGCFYDDPVHEVLGLQGDEWQSLYHFSMGLPVEDTRLTTEPGYDWERAPTS